MKYTKYITKQGDRWDLIAYKAYGNATNFKGIMQANKTARRHVVLPPGLELRIPILDAVKVRDNANLPPWKEPAEVDSDLTAEPVEVVEVPRMNDAVNPARYLLVNANNVEQGSGNITAGTIGRIVAPNARVTVNYENPIEVASGETLNIVDTTLWQLYFNSSDELIKVFVSSENKTIFTSGSGTNVGDVEVSEDGGTTFDDVEFPYDPPEGMIIFKRSIVSSDGVYTLRKY